MLLALAVIVLCACSGRGEATQTYTEDGTSFRHPEDWHVTGFSTTNDPHRLAVTSYPVPSDAVEGDCGGLQAVRLLSPGGAIVLLIDYGDRGSFRLRPESLSLEDGEVAEYECFGYSTMFRFRIGRRDFQAHFALGGQVSDATLDRALGILRSLEVR